MRLRPSLARRSSSFAKDLARRADIHEGLIANASRRTLGHSVDRVGIAGARRRLCRCAQGCVANRRIFEANQAVLHPVSQVVKAVTPGPIHDRLHDLNANLEEPRIFANDILQLRFGAAVTTAGRFITNSSIGVGGLFDIASQGGLKRQSGDFGQTLFVWGVVEGPYVVRPYFGPSTLRDSIGSGVDMVGDPVGWVLGARFGLAPTIATGALDASVRLSE